MRQLIRGLDFTGATALVAGSMIGTGVFFKAAIMSQQVGTPMLVLAAWLTAGLMSLAGALTYAELGGMLPEAGGEYNYLRAAYGRLPAFLDGWMRAVVASAGVAALGAGFATFLSAIVPMNTVWAFTTLHLFGRDVPWQLGEKELIAIAMIAVFGIANCAGVAFGGRLQTALTGAKVLGILIIIAGAFFFSNGSTSHLNAAHLNAAATHSALATNRFTAFGAAVLSALWACDGWAFMPMVAGEIKNPARNVPRALIVGVLSVLTLYGLVNLAYFYALPFDQVARANSTLYRDALPVASLVAGTFLGTRGPALLSILCMISIAGAMNGVIMSLARMPFAMSRDGLLASRFGELSERSRVPVWSVLAITVWSCILALSGTFDQLTDLTIFGQWIFYGLTGAAVFVLRRKMPDAPRPYRTIFYPLTPLIFVACAAALVINSFSTSPVEAMAGVILIALGLPVYSYYRYSRRHST
jgi:basic amino acid/polyamine antiporter, APA family